MSEVSYAARCKSLDDSQTLKHWCMKRDSSPTRVQDFTAEFAALAATLAGGQQPMRFVDMA